MKHLIFLALALFASTLFAQNTNDVTLTVVGSGKTIEEAKTNALRSAIEQAYGAFVSSNTEILNDEIVKDEIVSISSGNIKEYKILSQSELLNDLVSMTLSATVSVSSLQSYAQSKGATVEFAGGIVAMNAILTNLNTESEYIAIKNLCIVLEDLLSRSLDFSLNVEDTKCGGSHCEVTFKVGISVNQNIDLFYQLLKESLDKIAMNKSEINDFSANGRRIYLLHFGQFSGKFPKIEESYRLRSLESVKSINDLLYSSKKMPVKFEIVNNAGFDSPLNIVGSKSRLLLNDFDRQNLGFPAASYALVNEKVIHSFQNRGIESTEKAFYLQEKDIIIFNSPTSKDSDYGTIYATQTFPISKMNSISSFEITNMNLQ